MSDNWIAVIPTDPEYMPNREQQDAGLAAFRAMAPEADDVSVTTSDLAQFFDCGANLDQIRCPSCDRRIEMEWWADRMEDDHGDEGFAMQRFTLPCCQHSCSLNDLDYDWPQGFARFALDAMNPNLRMLTDAQVRQLECAIGHPLRVIYQHI